MASAARQGAPLHPPAPPWTRPAQQFGLFFLGAGFLAASVAVSRRSVLRRQRLALPRFYSTNGPAPGVDGAEGALLAAQALGLATLNVASFGVMLTGGLAAAFDLSSVDELRRRTKAALERPGAVDPEDEREFERLMDGLLARLGMERAPTGQAHGGLPKE